MEGLDSLEERFLPFEMNDVLPFMIHFKIIVLLLVVGRLVHHVHRAHDLCKPRVHTVNAAVANRRTDIHQPTTHTYRNAVILVPVVKACIPTLISCYGIRLRSGPPDFARDLRTGYACLGQSPDLRPLYISLPQLSQLWFIIILTYIYHIHIIIPYRCISRRTDQEIRNSLEGVLLPTLLSPYFSRRRELRHPRSSRLHISLTADTYDRLEDLEAQDHISA